MRYYFLTSAYKPTFHLLNAVVRLINEKDAERAATLALQKARKHSLAANMSKMIKKIKAVWKDILFILLITLVLLAFAFLMNQ